MAHTKTPWTFNKRTNCIVTPAGYLATMSDRERESDVPFGNKRHDIALIVHAPELLELAKEYLYEIEAGCIDTPEDCIDCISLDDLCENHAQIKRINDILSKCGVKPE